MKKFARCIALFCLPFLMSSHRLIGDETTSMRGKDTTTEQTSNQLKEPFHKMTQAEIANTGIQKLSPSEQEALAKWWCHHKDNPHSHRISKEVSVTSITNEGRNMVLSDGSKICFSASARKKVSRWTVGDKIGLGEPGKRGSVSIYHIASGQKVKGKREQAPQNTNSTDQKK